LKFIDEQHNTGAVLTRRGANRSQEIGQIGIEISTVGKAPLRFEVGADLDVPVLDLEGLRKSGKRPARPCEVGPHPFAAIETQQGHAQNRGKKSRQRPILGRLDLHAREPPGLGIGLYSIQKYGLSDASQPMKDQTARSPTCTDPIQRDCGALDELVSTSQLGRWGSGAWRIRVPARIHLDL
jgi:hypothetical protein